MKIPEVIRELKEALWDGTPAHVLGPWTAGPPWSVTAVDKTKQWTGKGLAVWLFVPVIWNKVPTVEVTLHVNPAGDMVTRFTSHPEGKSELVTHHRNVYDLIAHCKDLRERARRRHKC